MTEVSQKKTMTPPVSSETGRPWTPKSLSSAFRALQRGLERIPSLLPIDWWGTSSTATDYYDQSHFIRELPFNSPASRRRTGPESCAATYVLYSTIPAEGRSRLHAAVKQGTWGPAGGAWTNVPSN
jgi:hypothetical protein